MRPNFLIIVFDDEKTTLETIIAALKKGNFNVRGETVYLKTYPEPEDQSS